MDTDKNAGKTTGQDSSAADGSMHPDQLARQPRPLISDEEIEAAKTQLATDWQSLQAGECNLISTPNTIVDSDISTSFISTTEYERRFGEKFESKKTGPILGQAAVKMTGGFKPGYLVMLVVDIMCALTISSSSLANLGYSIMRDSTQQLMVVSCRAVHEAKRNLSKSQSVFSNLIPNDKLKNDIAELMDQKKIQITEKSINLLNSEFMSISYSRSSTRKLYTRGEHRLARAGSDDQLVNSDYNYDLQCKDGSVYVMNSSPNVGTTRIARDEIYLAEIIREHEMLETQCKTNEIVPPIFGIDLDDFIAYCTSDTSQQNKKRLHFNPTVIKHCHVRLGHASAKKLLIVLRSYYRVSADVEQKIIDIVDRCETCIKARPSPPANRIAMPKAKNFNSYLDIDLKIYSDKIILYVVCSFTNYVGACILPNKSGEAVIEGLYRSWINYFGVPSEGISSDNGKEFRNSEMTNFISAHGLSHMLSPAYTPNCAGRVERVHSVCDKIYEKCRQDNPDWSAEKCLSFACHTFNISPGGIMNLPPLFLVTGKMSNIPSIDNRNPCILSSDKNSVVSDMLNNLYRCRQALLEAKYSAICRKLVESKFFPQKNYDFSNGEEVFYFCPHKKNWFVGKILNLRGSVADITNSAGLVKSVAFNRMVPKKNTWNDTQKYYDPSFDVKNDTTPTSSAEKTIKKNDFEVINIENEKTEQTKNLKSKETEKKIIPEEEGYVDMKRIDPKIGEKIKIVFKEDETYHYDVIVKNLTKQKITILDLFDNETKTYKKKDLLFSYSRLDDVDGREGDGAGRQERAGGTGRPEVLPSSAQRGPRSLRGPHRQSRSEDELREDWSAGGEQAPGLDPMDRGVQLAEYGGVRAVDRERVVRRCEVPRREHVPDHPGGRERLQVESGPEHDPGVDNPGLPDVLRPTGRPVDLGDGRRTVRRRHVGAGAALLHAPPHPALLQPGEGDPGLEGDDDLRRGAGSSHGPPGEALHADGTDGGHLGQTLLAGCLSDGDGVLLARDVRDPRARVDPLRYGQHGGAPLQAGRLAGPGRGGGSLEDGAVCGGVYGVAGPPLRSPGSPEVETDDVAAAGQPEDGGGLPLPAAPPEQDGDAASSDDRQALCHPLRRGVLRTGSSKGQCSGPDSVPVHRPESAGQPVPEEEGKESPPAGEEGLRRSLPVRQGLRVQESQ